MKNGLTDQEAKVVQMLAAAWNEYLRLPIEHSMDRQEFCTAVHRCQDMVLARSGRREFNSLGGTDEQEHH